MTLAFIPRLACLTLACFFLVQAAASLIIAICAPRALRHARTLRAHEGASFLLTLRLLPSGLALLAALGLCVPSFLWFEPERFDEPVGLTCLILAVFGTALCAIAIARTVRASITSAVFVRSSRRAGQQVTLAGQYPPAVVIDSPAPFLALTGLIHPRVVISRSLAVALTPEELAVVLGHENAHRTSRDNLKRLCVSLSPFAIPRLKAAAELERSWIRCAEFSADERAVAGDERRSLALASALVRVARAGSGGSAVPVSIAFLADASDLALRVDRLLTRSSVPQPDVPVSRPASVLPLILLMALIPVLFSPAIFQTLQGLFERLVR